jgi:RNA polymerase sigma-70 factor (ECF subfamily)
LREIGRLLLSGAGFFPDLQGRQGMAADSTTQLQGFLDRMAAGDVAARGELIGRAYARLRRLAHKMLKGFPRVRSFEDTGDVLHDSLARLLRALEAVPPASVAEFFRIASRQIRWELLDLVQRYRKQQGPGGNHSPGLANDSSQSTPPVEAGTSTDNPSALAVWTEFHEQVEALPEKEREVFELLWYQEMTQAEAAAVLNMAESTVRRHWLAARRRLGTCLEGMQQH